MRHRDSGLSQLARQPHYIPTNTRLARYAANYYRPIIFSLTASIVLVTIVKYHNAPPMMIGGLFFTLFVYIAIFIWRIRMKKDTERRFYQPRIQFLRGQASIIGVTLMILLLTAYGYYDHMFWLLYVLAALLVSEHNSTKALLITLFELAVLYLLVSYLGWGIATGHWQNSWLFWQNNNSLGIHVLGIWLITFVFHYLVRNIQGRDKALEQQQKWLNMVAEQWVLAEQPAEQRGALLQHVQQFTGAQVNLWVPRLGDGQLINSRGEYVPDTITTYTSEDRPVILLQQPQPKLQTTSCRLIAKPPVNSSASAQIILPIRQLDQPHDLLGILDITYMGKQPSEYQLEMACANLCQLLNHARLVLINSAQSEQNRLRWILSFRMHRLLGLTDLAQQVVNDVIEELGFDFATISLVDDDENLIRGVHGRGANWADESIHPLSGTDVQSLTVCQGKTYLNNGQWQPFLNGRIWRKHQHQKTSRAWIPIPDPAENPPYPSLGTIEVGYHHNNRQSIPPDLIHLLEEYARHVGLAFANAENHQRTRDLAAKLTTLQAISREIQQAAAFYEPYQMIQLIGSSAEKLLDADIIMLYAFDTPQQLSLAYQTEYAIQGKGSLAISLDSGILHHLYTERSPYYRSDARTDPLLVNLKKDGHLARGERTFTQRQNIKSFAGIPLISQRNNILGILCINYRRRRDFYPELCHIIELFAEQATVALEETYDHRLARRMAIAQERDKLAAELHHSLSQHLFGLRQHARAAAIYTQRGDTDKAARNLYKVTDNASWSLQSLEEMLDYLQEQQNGRINFVEELTGYIEHMTRLQGNAVIEFQHKMAQDVPRQVQFCLLRIAREAINNALRHAQCHSITVSYCMAGNGAIQLTIQDDGRGFDVKKAQQNNRYGLGTMEYFARQINSDIDIKSGEGHGTHIHVLVSPLPKGV